MNNTSAIVGSGSEDIGRTHNVNARNAEDLARNRRLQQDAVIFAALEALYLASNPVGFINADHRGYPVADAAELAALTAEIRAQLSPIVTAGVSVRSAA